MTYCLGIVTDEGLVMASDSRSNAGFDQVNVCRKMYRFVQEGERVFVILTSGSLSISQSIMSLLRLDFDAGQGLAQARSMYHAARIVGECVRRVSEIDRASLERDSFTLQRQPAARRPGPRRGAGPLSDLPAGQPAAGDRGLTVPAARRVQVRAADSRSRHRHGHVARGGGEVRAAVVRRDDAIERHRRAADRPAALQEEQPSASPGTGGSSAMDQDLNLIHASWEQSLRRAVEQLPEIQFDEPDRAQHAAGEWRARPDADSDQS